ncbi:uncharacterized protein RJT20DRAFT_128366 [Scheffersomyces xylosifermentans]|uniref:uncharacterized protein n=1 Tax=Scheffersomyces xylosifermentans TaxID=1304137 RepID=UPI00315D6FB1
MSSSTSADSVAAAIQAWLEQYPDARSKASYTSPSEVLDLLEKSPETTTVLDLRNDRTPSYLQHSIHIPATGIAGYDALGSTVIDQIKKENPDLKNIVVHCNSSKKRAAKVAGWIQDYIEENDVKDYNVTILEGGIAGWVQLDEPYQKLLIKSDEKN